jgi:sarcosine oxidase subunit beta
MVETADAVVIGGGIVGTSIALRLAQRGVKKVVLTEKNYVASGPTGKSFANIVGYSPIDETLKMIQRGLDIFRNFDEEIGGDPGLVHTTRVRIVPEKDKASLESDAVWQKKSGVNLRVISPADLQELMPQINIDGIGAAVHYLDACYLNPVATAGAYTKRARDLGADIREETEVTDIKVSGNKIQSVITNNSEISTPVVVNAAGVWSPRIGKMVGIELPIKVKMVNACFFSRPWDFRGVIPTIHTVANQHMYRGEGDDLLLTFEVIAFERPDRLVENPDKFNEEVDEENVKVFLEAVPHILPTMKRASYRGGYNSLYDATPDQCPLLGKVPEVEGFYLCCGWSGTGFQQSPATGEVMAELITEDKTTLIDWSAFRLSRFKEGKSFAGAWGFH